MSDLEREQAQRRAARIAAFREELAELRQRYGQAGRQWVVERFSIDAMVEGNLGVYQRAIAKQPKVSVPERPAQ